MENAVEALKMAFAVMVFGMALTVSIISFNKVKATSDIVLYSKDETNYYDYQGATGKAAENRIIGLETIIPTLYKYYKENYTVLFRTGTYDFNTGDFSNLEYLTMYKTPSNNNLWGINKKNDEGRTVNSYEEIMNKKYMPLIDREYENSKSTNIFSFDLEEETLRHEPWTGSFDKAKNNIDTFLYGGIYNNPNNNTEYINYGSYNQNGTGGFISKYNNKKFVETIAEYTYTSKQTDDSTVSSLTKEKKKRIIIFTYITNQ